jgi:hypothetical protein
MQTQLAMTRRSGGNLSGEVFHAPDEGRTRLRALLAVMDGELVTSDVATLRSSFAKLVTELGLGPEPELRECPKCHGWGMKAATRCSGCWSKLMPL